MRKKIFFLLSTAILFTPSLITPQKVKAVIDCSFSTVPASPLVAPVKSLILEFEGSGIPQELKNYPSGGELKFSFPGTICGRPLIDRSQYTKPRLKIPADYNLPGCLRQLLSAGSPHKVEIVYEYAGGVEPICATKIYTIQEQTPTCRVRAEYSGRGDVDDNTWKIVVSDIDFPPKYQLVEIDIDNGKENYRTTAVVPPATIERRLPVSVRKASPHTVVVYAGGVVGASGYQRGPRACVASFEIAPRGATPYPTLTPGGPPIAPPQAKLEDLCKETKNKGECQNCVGGITYPGVSGAWTALGCIPTDITSFLKDYVFRFGLGLAGGVAFLLILWGGFTIIISTGEPQKIAQGREIITSALAGLLLIIFSVFILKFIGVDILKIPGFK